MKKAIILAGIKHCGKSTQGRLLSERLNCQFYDTDDIITQITGSTPREIYSVKGEESFKQAEEEACKYLAKQLVKSDSKTVSAVIATGGGICNNPNALEYLRPLSTIFFLETPKSVATERIIREITYANDGSMKSLPAYIVKENPQTEADVRRIFGDFFDKRVKLYRKLADVVCVLEDAPCYINAKKIWQRVQQFLDIE
ncbi:MAG: hypothetical protein J6B81_01735 [Spirochaetaceae bacterium]|nr:hypothetical protein [Spirochaetaceae bacterium]